MELGELQEVRDRLGAVWIGGVLEVLQTRNQELLRELNKLESVIDSLLVIRNKPPTLRKQWLGALAEYETTAALCVTYAKRHLQTATRP